MTAPVLQPQGSAFPKRNVSWLRLQRIRTKVQNLNDFMYQNDLCLRANRKKLGELGRKHHAVYNERQIVLGKLTALGFTPVQESRRIQHLTASIDALVLAIKGSEEDTREQVTLMTELVVERRDLMTLLGRYTALTTEHRTLGNRCEAVKATIQEQEGHAEQARAKMARLRSNLRIGEERVARHLLRGLMRAFDPESDCSQTSEVPKSCGFNQI